MVTNEALHVLLVQTRARISQLEDQFDDIFFEALLNPPESQTSSLPPSLTDSFTSTITDASDAIDPLAELMQDEIALGFCLASTSCDVDVAQSCSTLYDNSSDHADSLELKPYTDADDAITHNTQEHLDLLQAITTMMDEKFNDLRSNIGLHMSQTFNSL